MPRVNVFIQDENWPVWNSIPKGKRSDMFNAFLEDLRNDKTVIRTKDEAELAVAELPKKERARYCKNLHLIPSGRKGCMVKGCRYFQ